MADKKISALTAASTPLAGTEVLPIVQGGATVKVSVADLTAGRAPSVSGLTVSGLTASTALALNASKELVSVTNTGTGNNVLATSPTLVTPTLGVATATQIQSSDGTAAAPAYTFAGDTDNGFYKPATNELGISTAGVERFRFLSAGTILTGTTDDSFFGGSVTGIGFYSTSGFVAASRSSAPSAIFNRYTDDGEVVQFRRSGSAVGSVNVTTLATTYTSISDYRLKTVVGAVTGHGERIDALEPIDYTWNVNGLRTRGFLAHKFQEIYKDSVTGNKDAVDEDGKPVYQSMQAGSSEVIADLVAELQSLRKRVAILESK